MNEDMRRAYEAGAQKQSAAAGAAAGFLVGLKAAGLMLLRTLVAALRR